MGAPQALAFLLFAFIAAVTPGPSNTMILSTGTAVGALRGLPCSIGASFGMGTMIALSAFGVGEIVADAPMIVMAMKVAGSLFLLWLAWKIANAGTFEVKGRTKVAGFADAFLFQWLNPKGWLVALSAGTTYLVPRATRRGGRGTPDGRAFRRCGTACGHVLARDGSVDITLPQRSAFGKNLQHRDGFGSGRISHHGLAVGRLQMTAP